MVRDVESIVFWIVLPGIDPAFLFSPFSGGLEFSISFFEDDFLSPFEFVFGGDGSHCAVKAVS